MRLYGYLMLLTLVVAGGCNGHGDEKKVTQKNNSSSPRNNFIILLDISDRILANRDQVPKDIAVIKSIYGAFKTKLDRKDSSRLYYDAEDKLKLLAAPNWFCAGLDLSAEPPARKALLADKTEKIFSTSLPEIYQAAVNGNNNAAGSDIWQYFNDYLGDDLDKDAQNTLFIITDGYMTPKRTGDRPAEKNRFASGAAIVDTLKKHPDWEARFKEGDYGLLPVAKKFSNLRVILLQVNPKTDWSDEYSLLTKTWGKWLDEMGISNYNFIKNDSSAQVTASLGQLMNVQIDTLSAKQTIATAETPNPPAVTAPVVKAPDSAKVITRKKEQPIVVTAPAANTETEKKTTVVPKKNAPATPEVLPPDESDARLLNTSKTTKPAATKPAVANSKDDGDILQDGGAANGFNTGIKKDVKKTKNN